eukprot:NODE_3_length_80033_cov_0.932970.p75 type:complete len:106 gc:universal NODE_3_length_80033_cov_0.932970:13611-13928(+)
MANPDMIATDWRNGPRISRLTSPRRKPFPIFHESLSLIIRLNMVSVGTVEQSKIINKVQLSNFVIFGSMKICFVNLAITVTKCMLKVKITIKPCKIVNQLSGMVD